MDIKMAADRTFKGCGKDGCAVKNGYSTEQFENGSNEVPGKTAVDGKGCRERMAAMTKGYRKRLKPLKAILTWLREKQLQAERAAEREWLR